MASASKFRWTLEQGFNDLVKQFNALETEVLAPAADEIGASYESEGAFSDSTHPKRDTIATVRVDGFKADIGVEEYFVPLEYCVAEGVADYEQEFFFTDFPAEYNHGGIETVVLLMTSERVNDAYSAFADEVTGRIDSDLRLYSEEDESMYGWAFDVSE